MLIPHPTDHAAEEVSGEEFGRVILEHEAHNGFFKAKVLIHPSVASRGFQLFINGESNYKMMDYGKKYFCGTKLSHHRDIILRVTMNDGRYQRFKLEKAHKIGTAHAAFSEIKPDFKPFYSFLPGAKGH
ncbi:hypothetical protein GCM10011339_24810 [Echinicola rosea]|uniref:Galectin n=2 Tax=Echinicola rosea TaxID=1807691 RepID=A0ABQ1V271_9BACT|nr:hypothetical protein GCM10011339_24810 [Echinicola rosea]